MPLSKSTAARIMFISLISLSLGGSALAAGEKSNETSATNTKKNQKDYRSQTLTPEDQMQGSAADVELTRKIRAELMKSENLSTNAQNIKIITLNGMVTLRGPVGSMEEKAQIENTAKGMAGVKRVDNQLEVETKKTE